MEATAELVVDAAASHAAQGVKDHVQIALVAAAVVCAQEQVEGRGVRKFGRLTDAAVVRVVGPGECVGGVERQGRRRRCGAGRLCVGLLQGRHHLLDGALHVLVLFAVGLGDGEQQAREARHPVAVLRREVRPAVERLALGSQEDGHRPAAVTGEHLHRVHVDVVDVGPLLAVDLDVDEVLVHQPRDLRVLERLALHDVTPVTGRVADAEQDGLVLPLRRLRRLGSPGVPIDRIVRVLTQVGTRFVDQAVGHCALLPRAAAQRAE